MSGLPILGYHNVAEPPADAWLRLLYVRPADFERQLWALRRLGLRGVSMSEGLNQLSAGTARGCVVMTFDDGYADTLTTAAPLLRKYGFTATCYVVTDALGSYNRWDVDFVRERKALMDRTQIEQWLAAGMEVGSHSCSHPRLPELDGPRQLAEIHGSRAALRQMLSVEVEHFAYPYGKFTGATLDLVRQAGYRSAVTVMPGVARASDDRLRLPRILVNGERGVMSFLAQAATPYWALRQWLRRSPP